jgi:hypothetical protein
LTTAEARPWPRGDGDEPLTTVNAPESSGWGLRGTAAVSMREVVVRLRRSTTSVLVAAALLYGSLWSLLNVALVAHWFPLPFLTGSAFYRRYAHTVGGPAQYAAGLFSQTYSRQWAGVLAFTLLALAAWAIARGVLRRFSSGPCSWPAAAFPVVVLVLASRYLSVLFILPMVSGLASAWLYVALRERTRGGRAQSAVIGLFLVASIPLYWLLASGFLYLCAIAALFELLLRRRPVSGVAWIVFGALVPYGTSYVFFEPDVAARYLRWMSMQQRDAVTTGLVAFLYLFVPVGAVVAFLARSFGVADRLAPRARLAVRVVGFAMLAVLASRLVALRFDTSGWIYADYLLEDGRPAEALDSLAQSPDDSEPARFLTFYALSRTGRLPWEMFHYPQLASSDELLLRDPKWDPVAGIANWRSDLYLDLGRVNESQRWAHEALAVEGETPRVLERMAVVYVLNDNPEAARTFVRALAGIPFQAAHARQFLEALDRDPRLSSDPLIARIRPLMLRTDYVGDWSTEQILLQCLEANPTNKMAFEFLLTHYMLTSDLKGIASLAPRLKDFYHDLPTHVQEALVGYRNENGSLPPGLDRSAIDGQTESRFRSFLQIFARYQNGPVEEIWKALAPGYGATWWFFHVFGRTEAGPPPLAGADQSQATAGPQ